MIYWTDAESDWTPSVSYFQDLVVGDMYELFAPWKNRLWPVGWLEPELILLATVQLKCEAHEAYRLLNQLGLTAEMLEHEIKALDQRALG